MASTNMMCILFFMLVAPTFVHMRLHGPMKFEQDSYVKTIKKVALQNSTVYPSKWSVFIVLKGVHGDIYDCFQVDKQPALNHPSLFGHIVQTTPSKEFEENLAKVRTRHSGNSSRLDLKKIWLSGTGCPTGSIPLRRYSESSKAVAPPGRLEFAGMVTTVKKEYYGASAIIDIYNPSVSDPNQFSAAGIIVQKGEEPSLNQIQAGWMVNLGLYGDKMTRFYTRWTSGEGRGCYNTICPGFVSINTEVPIDFVFMPTSILEGQQFDVKVSLNLDDETGWWLSINDTSYIGYWPNELFASMNNAPADIVKWGGQVNTTTGVSPPMGASQFKNGNYNKTCYMRHVQVNTPNLVDLDNSSSTIAESRCYFTDDNSFKDEDYHRFSFLFGGSGGDKYQCF